MSRSFIVTHMWCSSFHGLLLPLFEFINSRLEQNKRNRNGAETVQGVLNCWCCLTFLSTWGWYAEPTRQCRVSSCIPHESVNDNIFPSVEIEFHFFACLPLRRRQHRVSIWTRTDKDRSQDRCSWLEDDRWCLLHSSQALDHQIMLATLQKTWTWELSVNGLWILALTHIHVCTANYLQTLQGIQ